MADNIIEKMFAAVQAIVQPAWDLIFIQNGGHRLYWMYLLSYLAIACLLCIFRRPTQSSLFASLLPTSVYTNRSFFTDIKIYLLNGVLASLLSIGVIVSSAALVASFVSGLLAGFWTSANIGMAPSTASTIVFSAAFVLLTDLGLFVAHYISHKVPFFWAFHKVHHSAEVLTPVSAYRFHPVDTFLNSFILSLTVGPIIGIYQFLYTTDLVAASSLIYGNVMFLFLLTANFRHSHLALHFPQVLSHWLVSPAMHRVHHSTNPIHFDKNLGIIFSVWDRIANTYFLPDKDVVLEFGIGGGEEKKYRKLISCYLLPIKQAGTMFVNAAKRVLSAVS